MKIRIQVPDYNDFDNPDDFVRALMSRLREHLSPSEIDGLPDPMDFDGPNDYIEALATRFPQLEFA